MAVFTLGKITVPSAGTPVQATATRTLASQITVQPLSGNTGNVYPGNSALVKATLVGAFHDGLSAGQQWHLEAPSGANLFDVSQFYIDVDNNGEGAVIYYVQA